MVAWAAKSAEAADVTDVTWAEEGAGRLTAAARRVSGAEGAGLLRRAPSGAASASRRSAGSAAGGRPPGTMADLLGLHRAVLDAS